VKVHFSGVNFSARTGPNVFASRLARAMCDDGIELVDVDDYDVALVFIEPNTKLNFKKPYVHRLDGIWSKPENFDANNQSIKRIYDGASHVVFQSKFDRTFIERHFGACHNESVIHNGTTLKNSAGIFYLNDALSSLRDQNDYVFVCSANWHRQKRLRENIELFKHLRSNILLNKRCVLIVMGNNPDHVVADPTIFYTGSLSEEDCDQVFNISDAMFHLAWGDHCPNTVIEALSWNVPVFCSDVGGTCEIVGENGFVLKDAQFFGEKFDYDVPPRIDVMQVSEWPIFPSKFNIDTIDIRKIALKYAKILKKVI
jgi:glycosyltransferase involved in cell wall biosynthesis